MRTALLVIEWAAVILLIVAAVIGFADALTPNPIVAHPWVIITDLALIASAVALRWFAESWWRARQERRK